ncbi:MAG: TolB family protein, partial [Gammaproteobacteria bacterium]
DHYWPELLPGGSAVLFTIVPTSGGMAAAQIAVLNVETGEQKVLLRGGSSPRYVPTGHIVYGAAGTLWAVAFDLGRLEVRSDPLPVVQDVVMKPSGAASFGVGRDGSLVYRAGTIAGDFPRARTLVWVDRQGREEPIKAPPRLYSNPRLSPDGTKVAVEVFVSNQDVDVWTWHLANHTLTRLTFGAGQDQTPVWTPDGQRIAFSSSRAGSDDNLYWQAADGTGVAERLVEGTDAFPTSFSPDGTQLLFGQVTPSTGFDIGILSLEGGRRAVPLVKTSFNELNAEVSPDGHSLAYQSNESGQHEIYVRPFPEIDRGRWQVSTSGGRMPVWARSGKELFYLEPSGALMSVPIESGRTFRAGNPAKLVEGGYVAPLLEAYRTYDVSADSQRFLMIKEAEIDKTATTREIVIVQHWLEELKRLVPTK